MLVMAAFCATGGPAPADEAARELLAGCVDLAETRADAVACRGAHARICMEGEGGATTIGMSACAAEEAEAWERLIDETYADLVLLARRAAIRAAEEGRAAAPLEAMLEEAQRAWLAFRDADCDQEYAIWGEGSQRQVAGAWCLLERNATRLIELRDKRAQMELD
jgi:uncharacterized protein YecT (DUF1311 family)